ncbi:MAG: Glycerol-3-phosphate acyltransferase [Firmicutes bacterium ADurb.Bin506]|nr:MAG: Glycerol-3-phosphate acyltransferase [Firmicutes bacterium ADurb.Bin506]
MTASGAAILILAYLLGSIPFGVILGRAWTGVDVRKHGSGNIGATNVLRTLGFRFALATFVLDAFKGVLPVLLARVVGQGHGVVVLAGIAAVVGHNWPVFLGFRGGKGIATSWGFISAAVPAAGLVFALTWIAVVIVTRYASLGSMIGAAATPVVCLLVGAPWQYVMACIVIAVFAVVRHRANIRRLLEGNENTLHLKRH